jgi:hypothetical protein
LLIFRTHSTPPGLNHDSAFGFKQRKIQLSHPSLDCALVRDNP